jgi:hypothetical protein
MNQRSNAGLGRNTAKTARHTPAIHLAVGSTLSDSIVEPLVKQPPARVMDAENSRQEQGEFKMKQITVVLALMCALSAYVSYPSASASGRGDTLAMSMQESCSLPVGS